jgi:ABC-type dipeptide/oligopeptide/nickel transport system permease component
VEASLATLLQTAPAAAHFSIASHLLLDNPLTGVLIVVMLFLTAFLFILNTVFTIAFRKKRLLEVLSFIAAALIELGIFAFLLVLRLGLLTHVPLNLPPGLPVDRAEIGATIALAIGLFPAAYWQRMSMSQLRQRMAEDAKVIKNRDGVRIRSNTPGEWLN